MSYPPSSNTNRKRSQKPKKKKDWMLRFLVIIFAGMIVASLILSSFTV